MDVFDSLPSGYKYLKISTTDFRIAGITNAQSAKKWVQEFSIATKSTWRVKQTPFLTGQKIAFKYYYKCVLNPGLRKYKGKHPTKHTGCPAKMRVTVKVKKKRNRSKDDLVDWPCVVQFSGTHNHDLEESLKYRDVPEETKEKLIQLFKVGFSARGAHYCLETDLILKYGAEYDKVAADRHHLPSNNTVYHLHKKFASENGTIDTESMMRNMLDMLAKYNEDGVGKAHYFPTKDSEHYFIVICTPIMAKAHSVSQSRELVRLEASWGAPPMKHAGRKPKLMPEAITIEKRQLMLYFFTSQTPAGGLPLGLIITDTDEASVFEEAVTELKKIFPENCFGGQGFPNVFLADSRLNAALRRVFPHTSMLLCQAHFLKQVWAWLGNPVNKIHNDDKNGLYDAVKKVLQAPNLKEMEECHSELLCAENINKYENFINYYYLELWPNKDDWVNSVRQYCTRSCNPTVELVVRYLKDRLLQKITGYGLGPLVGYVLAQYESYLERRLIDFCQGKWSGSVMLFSMSFEGRVHNVEPVSDSHDVFLVTSSDKSITYTVDLSSGVCSRFCCYGKTGNLCSHAAAVLTFLIPVIESSFSQASPAFKAEIMYNVVGASVKPKSLGDDSDSHDYDACFDEGDTEPDVNVQAHVETVESFREAKKRKEIEENSRKEEAKKRKESPLLDLSAEENDKLESFFQRVKDGLASDPRLFVPAVRAMLRMLDQHASSDTNLAVALQTFGVLLTIPAGGTMVVAPSPSLLSSAGVNATNDPRRTKQNN